jgi:cyclopropane fatty-acyl-phospholipid synthase-like methyltransferase
MKDKSWEKFGSTDPYYAVCTQPQYKSNNLDGQSLEEFFNSGKDHVTEVLKNLREKFGLENNHFFANVLDFGCGTGRLLIPFSDHAKKVVGIDISQPMIDEAEKNLAIRNINNVDLIKSTDISDLNLSVCFDLVHSYIVLQHIPTEKGYTIIDKLISIVCKGGYGALHLTYANHKSTFKNKIYAVKNRYFWIRKLGFLLQGKPINTPVMQMNNYNIEKVFRIFLSHSITKISVDFTDHGGFLGAMIYFKK